ncbi:MAG: hypothetical protein CME04_01870 [Gemmatimonadaceae bacterium]|jgi:hypothetical protein|nr:hypothetical protein [Gemmatimonadaceae bacterium]|tara:strand:- start:33 stop:995 length:963 start_codon:yes stop_codon:yes gene_type:complete
MSFAVLITTESQTYLADDTGGGEPVPLREAASPAAVDETADLTVIWLPGGDIILLRPDVDTLRLTTELDADVRCIRLLSVEPFVLLVGTEPAQLYRVTGDGSAERLEGFDRVDGRDAWSTPWGGPPAVRSLADASGGWLYADIHVGSIARSGDGGDTWEPVDAAIHPDVHEVATCPKAPERLYANTADAVFVSEDRGSSWRHCVEGVGARYGRALAVHCTDPDLLLASLSRGPHDDGGEGRLYRSPDAGVSWRHLTIGFPPFVVGNIDTACVAFGASEAADRAWAAEGERLYRSEDRGETWRRVWEAPERITGVAAARVL